jgi:hypothetical protein
MKNAQLLSTCFVLLIQSVAFCQPVKPSDQEDHWSLSKKLTYFPELIPERVPPPNSDQNPTNIQVGQTADFAAWSFVVLQIVDEKNTILQLGRNSYWLADFESNGLADGDRINLVGPAKMLESKTYITVDGSKKTVRAFKLITSEEMQKQRLDSLKDKFEVLELKSGDELNAFAISNEKGLISLIDTEGKTHEIKLSELTTKAQSKVRNQLKIFNGSKRPR